MRPVQIGGPKRSPAFQLYLEAQTPERRAEILAGEALYRQTEDGMLPNEVRAIERDFSESMQGYRDDNEGVARIRYPYSTP